MFFIFSKLLVFIITPLVWIIVLLLFSVFSKNEIRKRKCLKWALGLTLFCTNPFIFDECARLWEIPATGFSELKKYDVGIILGGMSVNDEKMDRVQFYRGVDRMIQAIDLYKRGYIKKIIFTGGSGRLSHPEMKEGELIKPYMIKMGVAPEDLWIENESKNTRENAVFTKTLIEKEKITGNFLIITSAFHMRRGMGCFKKVGIVADPYSTDRYAGPRSFELDNLIVPNISALNDWTNFIHEMVGFITYKIMGYA